MLKRKYTIKDLKIEYYAEKCACLRGGEPLFLDIETTGLASMRSHLYLVTILFRSEMHQWFLDQPAEEKNLLIAVLSFLEKQFPFAPTLVTYNGRAFDLRYLEKKCTFYGLMPIFRKLEHLDLFHLLRPFGQAFGLPSLRQRDWEKYLHLDRKDDFSGKELISDYQDYLRSRSKDLLERLFLHNLEDVKHMTGLLPLLFLKEISDGHFSIQNLRIQKRDLLASAELRLEDFPPPVRLFPKGFSFTVGKPPLHLEIKMDDPRAFRIHLKLQGIQASLKHFLMDYKRYYYLPEEEMILPDRLARFVDASHRRRARASECYQIKEDFFLPQQGDLFLPTFQKDYREMPSYFEADQLEKADPSTKKEYFRQMLNALLIK